jgi:hypothetical protein
MNAKNVFRFSLISVATIVVLLATFGLIGKPAPISNSNNVFNLQLPPFVDVVNAQEAGPQAIASFLDDEAGISAYFSTTAPIDLALVRPAFRTIEVQTADYIIGSVAIADYPESEDVHVYVHTDGWLLAYYLKADPTAKIFDWRRYVISATIPTKLEKALSSVVSLVGVTSFNATFYDFRYPNANRLMLIAEDSASSDNFQVNVPGSFAYYERSWSLGSSLTFFSGCSASWNLDSSQIHSTGSCGFDTSQGFLTPAQLTANTFHTVTVSIGAGYGTAWGGLALDYRVP